MTFQGFPLENGLTLFCQSETNVIWKDTVLVPQNQKVIIHISFQDFTDKTTCYCHILDYEDLGMIGSLLIT